MANTNSAKKRIRQNEKRRIRNRTIISRTRTYIKRANSAIVSGDFDASDESVKKAIRELDRSVSKGIIHPNNASRRKSRLMARLNAAKNATQTDQTS